MVRNQWETFIILLQNVAMGCLLMPVFLTYLMGVFSSLHENLCHLCCMLHNACLHFYMQSIACINLQCIVHVRDSLGLAAPPLPKRGEWGIQLIGALVLR